MVDAGKSAEEIVASYQNELLEFEAIHSKYLIY